MPERIERQIRRACFGGRRADVEQRIADVGAIVRQVVAAAASSSAGVGVIE